MRKLQVWCWGKKTVICIPCSGFIAVAVNWIPLMWLQSLVFLQWKLTYGRPDSHWCCSLTCVFAQPFPHLGSWAQRNKDFTLISSNLFIPEKAFGCCAVFTSFSQKRRKKEKKKKILVLLAFKFEPPKNQRGFVLW